MTDASLPTCGSLYRDVMADIDALPWMQERALPGTNHTYSCSDRATVHYAHRALGFIAGQAEKTFLGACRMFLIRPAPEWLAWTVEAMQYVCRHYGLAIRLVTVQAQDPWVEVWGYQPDWETLVNEAAALPYPSDKGHRLRGALCGIWLGKIDTAYHTRESHLTRCEGDR